MDWFELAPEWSVRDELSEWQRELVTLYRLSCDIHNGGYLQFLVNNGRDAHVRASRVLHHVGAVKTAAVIDKCLALVEKHFPIPGQPSKELNQLLANEIIGRDGTVVKRAGSILSAKVLEQIRRLSWEFMEFPEDWGVMVQNHYAGQIRSNNSATR